MQAAAHWLEDGNRFKVIEFEHEHQAIIELFYHPADAVSERKIRPVGLDPQAMYCTGQKTYSGAELMKNGFQVALDKNMHLKWRAKMILLDPQ